MEYPDITKQILKCAFRTHNTPCNGFQEIIYQRALEIEMDRSHILFSREFELPVLYGGIQIGARRVDFPVKRKISGGLKAVIQQESMHLVQAMNHPEAYNPEIGLLMSFGANNPEFRRVTDKKFRPNLVNRQITYNSSSDNL